MNWIVEIYDRMAAHRRWCLLSLVVATAVLLGLVSRLEFREDIADFLPADGHRQEQLRLYEEASGAGRIVAVIEMEGAADADALADAAGRFAELVEQRDTGRLASSVTAQADLSAAEQAAQFVYANIPYFLEADDYRRMDSVMSRPGYVAQRLQEARELLMLPGGGLLAATVERDPLGLFAPVAASLRQAAGGQPFELYDGYIFTADMRRVLVLVDSRFGNSETRGNSRLLALLRECADSLTAHDPGVRTRFIGGPVIAVDNARQIRADSVLSVSIAAVLILLLLYRSFRSIRHLLLVVVAIGWGWLFALGGLSLVDSEVSVIVVGISSIILGIAVNYPLHLVSHLQHTPDVRQALGEIARPLVVGNVTTVGAFLTLVPLHSVALRDLGLFSALLLVGTILFVLLWMPQLLNEELRMKNEEFLSVAPLCESVPSGRAAAAEAGRAVANTIPANAPARSLSFFMLHASLLFLLTLFFAYHARSVAFDTDLSHINYLTDEQKAGLALLGKVGNSPRQSDARFLLSDSVQQRRLAQWRAWTAAHGPRLTAQIAAEAPRAGFAEGAFDGFAQILAADYRPQPLTYFSQLPPSLLLQNVDIRGLNREMLNSLTDHFNYIGWACSLVVFLFLWASFRSLLLAVVAFLPMAVGWLWILGIMSLCDIEFNIVNIILATFIFGQGDDYTIFMTEGAVSEIVHRRPMLASYRRAIILSALIMFAGIGSLIVARHPALHSLAEVTIVGMASVVLMALVLPPALVRLVKELRVKN